MAVTDHHRIELENSFNPNEKYVKEVVVEINGEKNIIPFSKGINVLIGDNSVGKSLFLNAITDNCKKLIEDYMLDMKNISRKTSWNLKQRLTKKIFSIQSTREIRSIFDEDGLKPDKYLSNFYPNAINATKYRSIVDTELEKKCTML